MSSSSPSAAWVGVGSAVGGAIVTQAANYYWNRKPNHKKETKETLETLCDSISDEIEKNIKKLREYELAEEKITRFSKHHRRAKERFFQHSQERGGNMEKTIEDYRKCSNDLWKVSKEVSQALAEFEGEHTQDDGVDIANEQHQYPPRNSDPWDWGASTALTL